MEEILILLASYNGELYIKEQLFSLLSQTYRNIKIIISDDGSSDGTIKIIEDYMKIDNRIILIHNNEHGILKNFNNLLNYAKTLKNNYIMFCDQDDVWLENKVEMSYNYFRSYEQKDEPLLIYTNLKLVDKELNNLGTKIICADNKIKLELILHQNPIYGCTMLFNRALLNLFEYVIPDKFIHHDHYVTYVAYLRGKIKHLNKELILYRQHGNNNSGDLTKRKWSNLKRNIILFNELINETNTKYFHYLSNKDKKLITELVNNDGVLARLKTMISCRIFKLTKFGTVNFLLQNYMYGGKNVR